MYNSKYYTCEQVDQRLLQGYYDDAVAAGYTGSKAQYLAELLKAINHSANPTLTSDKVVYDPAISGLTSKNVKAALDELVDEFKQVVFLGDPEEDQKPLPQPEDITRANLATKAIHDDEGNSIKETYATNENLGITKYPHFNVTNRYSKGTTVYLDYDRKLYKFIVDHEPGAWNHSHVVQIDHISASMSTYVVQESGEAEDKVMSQKATITAIADETTRAKAAEEANATAINTQDQKLSELELNVNNFFVVDNIVATINYKKEYSSGDEFIILPYLGKDILFHGEITVEAGAKFVIWAKNKLTGSDFIFVDARNESEQTTFSFDRVRPDLELVDFRIFFTSTSGSGVFSLNLQRTDATINDNIKELNSAISDEITRASESENALDNRITENEELKKNEPSEIVLNVLNGKYIGYSGNLGSSTEYALHYATCKKGDTFKLRYKQSGPSASASQMYAIYSADNVEQANSSTLLIRGDFLTSVIADEEYIINIDSDEAHLICFAQYIAGIKKLVPIVSKTELVVKNVKDVVETLYDGSKLINEELSSVKLEELIFLQDSFIDRAYIASSGNLGSSDTYGCYKIPCSTGDKFALYTLKSLNSPITRSYAVYNSDSTFNASTLLQIGKISEIGVEKISIDDKSAKCILVGWRNVADIHLLKESESRKINDIESAIYNMKYDGTKVHFDFNHSLKPTTIRSTFDLSDTVHPEYYGLTGLNSLMFQLQDKMDILVSNHSSYITKFDSAEMVGLSYPAYAEGVVQEGQYHVTPRYRIYGYKLSYNGSGVNGKCNRPTKLLITGSVHGNEVSASLNLYTIMKELCEDYLDDVNLFRMRGAFDIYIIPCINGYSTIHRNRVNANGVNINRNFPIEEWSIQGDSDPSAQDYRGPSAGSEFETQLIMKLIEQIKPDMYIDAHNFGTDQALQFYAEIPDYHFTRAAYDCIADVSYTLKKAFPQWFGSNYALLKGDVNTLSSGHAPASSDNDKATCAVWAFRHGTQFSATLEISGGINYNNGVLNGHDAYSEEAYSIGEYTVMNFLMRYGEQVSNRIISTRYYEWL